MGRLSTLLKRFSFLTILIDLYRSHSSTLLFHSCQRVGGVNVLKGFAPGSKFEKFELLKSMFRKKVSFCEDKPGNNDQSAKDIYGAPESLPFFASFKAGGVANFQFDLNTSHGGYLEFYLCDVSVSGGISKASFNDGGCYLLERAIIMRIVNRGRSSTSALQSIRNISPRGTCRAAKVISKSRIR